MGWVAAFFAWPAAGVWSNLLASLLWTLPAFAVHHVAMRRHVTRQTQEQTEQITEHITSTMQGPQP